MKRGRPLHSEIRQHLVEILAVSGPAYGYQLHKWYCEIFPACTRENVYYNLKKGLELGVFDIAEVRQEKGDYSWGKVVEKKYYKVGPKAEPRGDAKVKDFFEKMPQKTTRR